MQRAWNFMNQDVAFRASITAVDIACQQPPVIVLKGVVRQGWAF